MFLTVVGVLWVFLTFGLAIIGVLIGIIIGIALLFLEVGFINAMITSFLWFDVKTSFWSLLSHGLVLLITLVILDPIGTVPNVIFPGVAMFAVTRIVLAFGYGYLGKRIAGIWRETGVVEKETKEEPDYSKFTLFPNIGA